MKFFGKIKDWFVRHKPTKRRLIQVYAALLYNANIKGFVNGSIYTGNSKYMCVPGLNCYSCPGAVGACPLGALQNALASSNTKAWGYIFGILILFGLLLGRTICGFLCPIGLLQDLLYKIKSPKLKKNKVTRVLSYFKYLVLIAMVILIPLAYAGVNDAIPAFCKYICPSGTLLGSISLLANSNNGEDFFSMLGPLFTWKFCVLVLIVVGSIFIYRLFCRFLCPLGAIYSFFCRVAMIGIKLDKQKCVDCGLCIQTCKMDIKHVGDHECINCGDCLKVCPTHAISWKGSKIFLHPNAIEEGGEDASGEKVALASLLASSTANGGTIAIDAGGNANVASENVATENTAKDNAAADKAVLSVQTAEAAEQPKVEAEADSRIRIFYVFNKNGVWQVRFAGGNKKFINRAFALQYVQEAAKDRAAMIYMQRKDGTFALALSKGKGEYVAADGQAFAEDAASETVDNGDEQLSIFGEPETVSNADAENEAVTAEIAADGHTDEERALTPSKAEIKAKKKAYHKTIAYQKKRNKVLEICAWILALIVLAAALVYYNFIAEDVEATVTYKVGDTVESFTMKKYFGDEDDTYTLQDDLDDGKIVILNFWYIGCQPCQAELPEFGELAAEYSDDISLVVIHSSTVSTSSLSSLEGYVQNYMCWDFWAYDNVSFTLDNSGEDSLYKAFDGTDAYPMTVILDSGGVMRYRYTSKMEKAELLDCIETLLSE